MNHPTVRGNATRKSDQGSKGPPLDVDAYIDAAPMSARPLLRQLRTVIRSTAPSAMETGSYGIPTYKYRGERLVYFAGYKDYVGVYALVHDDDQMPDQLRKFVDHKSTLRFRLDRPMPAPAIRAALRRKMRLKESNPSKENANV